MRVQRGIILDVDCVFGDHDGGGAEFQRARARAGGFGDGDGGVETDGFELKRVCQTVFYRGCWISRLTTTAKQRGSRRNVVS